MSGPGDPLRIAVRSGSLLVERAQNSRSVWYKERVTLASVRSPRKLGSDARLEP
jgi:hypothetical protein